MVNPRSVSVVWDPLPVTASNYPGDPLSTDLGPLGFTVHGNANPWSTAANEGVYLRGSEAAARGASWHGTVDDLEYRQHIPFDVNAWHAADGCNNRLTDVGCFRTIATEICERTNENHQLANENAAQIMARVAWGDPVFQWGSGRTRGRFEIAELHQHYEVSDNSADKHDCPQRIRHALDAPWNWAYFVQRVGFWYSELLKLDDQPTTPQVPPIPEFPPPALPNWWEHGLQTRTSQHDGGVTWHYVNFLFTAKSKTPLRVRPSRLAEKAGRVLDPGDRIRAVFIARKPDLVNGKTVMTDWGLDAKGRAFQLVSLDQIVRISQRK